jgi:hypothetical protein
MRMLRLLIVLPVIGVSLAAGPAVAAEDDPKGLNGLIGQILRNVTAKAPTASDDPVANGGGADAGKKSAAAPANTQPSEGGVSASLQQGPLQAVDDTYTVVQNSGQNTLTPDVLDNDKSPSTAVFVNSVSEPPHGSINGDATVYTPDTNFVGTDTFIYTFQEPQTGTSNQATVTIQVGQKAVSGDDDLLHVVARCSGDVTFTNISDLGLEGTYGDLPSEVDGDFVLGPDDSETIRTGRDELEYRADGPGDESQEGLIQIPGCSHDDDDDGDDDDEDDESDEDDDDGDDDGGLPDTGANLPRSSLAVAITLVAVGASLLNVTRFRRNRRWI